MPNLKRGFALLTIAILCALAIPKVQAQDAPPPVITAPTIVDKALSALAPILSATNWTIGGYGTFDQTTRKIGGGIGGLYNVNNYVGAWIRAEYNGKDFSGGSGSLSLQLPIAIFGGKAYLIPNAYTGAAVTFAGLGRANGTPQGIVGAGGAITWGNLKIFAEYEKRTSDNDKILAGAGWSF